MAANTVIGMPLRIVLYGSTLLFGLAAGSLQAQPTQVWQRALDAPSRERLDIHYAEPLPEGGYRLVGGVIGFDLGSGRGIYGVYQDFDADDRPRGAPRFGPPPSLRTRDAAVDDVVLPFEPRAFTFDLRQLPPESCLRADLGGGLERREVEREQRLLSYSNGLDGEDGGFAATFLLQGPAPRMQRLHRQQADCSLELIGDFPFWFDSLHNSSVEAAVFAVTDGDKPGEPESLRYLDRGGQRWQRELGVEGDSLRFLQPLLELEGELLIHSVGEQRSTLRRVDAEGATRWKTELPRALIAGGSQLGDSGLLLGSQREGALASSELVAALFDADSGALRWRTPLGEGGFARPIVAVDQSAAHLFAVSRGLHQDLVELDALGTPRWLGRLPAQAEPLLRLEDGRLLAARGSHFAFRDVLEIPGRRLIRTAPESASADDPGQAVEVDWVTQALALRAEGEGSLLLLLQSGRYVFEALDADGGLRWRTALPIDTLRGAPGFDPAFTLLQDGELICLALRRRGLEISDPAERSLSCVDRGDGGLRLLRADFQRAEDGDVFPLLLRDRGDGSLELYVQSIAACVSFSNCRRSLQRIEFAADGSTRWSPLGEATPPARLDARALLGDGRLLASDWSGQASAPQRLLAIDPQGQVEVLAERAVLDPQLPPARQALEDGSRLLVFGVDEAGRSQLRRLGGSGQTLQALEFEGQLAGAVASSIGESGPIGFAIPVQAADGARQVRLYTAEGSLRWSHALPVAAGEQLLGLDLRADGSVQLASLRGQRLLLQRLSADEGRVEQAGSMVLPGPFKPPLLWTDEGEPLVLADGARVYAAAPQPADLRKLRLDESAGCDQPPPSGFWFDPGSAGQGLFFHPAADGGLLTATWLSFTPDGDTDRADLRWFSAFGETEGDGPILLTLQSSSGGRFASLAAERTDTVGTLSLQRLGCELLAVDYGFDSGEFEGRSGRSYLQPAAPQALGALGGIWFSPEAPGQGLLLQTLSDGDAGQRLVGAWASFDPDGAADDESAQHWFTLDGAQQADGSFRADVLRTIGGSFDDRATSNHLRVGQVQLRFPACDRLQLDYRFEGHGAAEYSGLQGSLSLQRLDGCVPD